MAVERRTRKEERRRHVLHAVVNKVFTERLWALVYTERLICGNFAVYSPVNGRKSGVNVSKWMRTVSLPTFSYMAVYVGFSFN